MNDGHQLKAEKLQKEMDGGGASFVSLEKKEIPVPKSAYMLAVTGAT